MTPQYSPIPDRPEGWTLPPDPPAREYGQMWEKFKAMQAENAAFQAPMYDRAGHQGVNKVWAEREAEKVIYEITKK